MIIEKNYPMTIDLSTIKRGDDVYVDEEWNEERGILLYGDDEEQNLPEDPDCSNDLVPPDVTNMQGKREIKVLDLVSATKVLFSGNKGKMYLFLNSCLRKGWLDDFVGCKVLNRTINRDVCNFPHVDYWRIDRENFFADVEVSLKLQTVQGERLWEGYLICWCHFEENEGFDRHAKKKKPRYRFICSIEDLTDTVERPLDEFDRLDNHLAPYLTNDRVEEIANGIWSRICEGALTNPRLRDAKMLAEKMGMTIKYCPIYEHRDVDSIVFFKEDELVVGEDRYEKREYGRIEHIKAEKGEPIIIPANTIVINTNKLKREYSSFNIFHECFHYDQHYLFYCLQEMASNDRRVVPMKTVVIEEGKEYKDTLHFIENQANRGGLALMMPADHTKQMIWEECGKVTNCAHSGEMYEAAGEAMHGKLAVPEFRIRQRMIQLGNVRARGAMNKANRKSIAPFAFDPDSWRDSEHTFVIDYVNVRGLSEKNADLRYLLDSGKYVYADGHVVKNTPECVRWDPEREEHLLTDWAYAHVDKCCLRFERKYVQKNVGRYVYGRLYFDPNYEKMCKFYMDDEINRKQLSMSEAQYEYENNFPEDFKEAFEKLMRKNGETQETMAEKLGTTRKTLREWLQDPDRKITPDFVVYVSQLWKLPDFIGDLLMESAGKQLSRKQPRNRALKYIRKSLWDQGVDAANEYLESHEHDKLSLQ